MVKNPPAMQETWVWSLGWKGPLEEGMATHSSTLVWRIPMDSGAWWAAVHGVAKSRTWLSDSVHKILTINSKYIVLTICQTLVKHFTYMNSPNLYKNPIKYIFYAHFYRWTYWGTGSLNNLHNITYLVCEWAGTWTRTSQTSESLSINTVLCHSGCRKISWQDRYLL